MEDAMNGSPARRRAERISTLLWFAVIALVLVVLGAV
jgi:predicted nucleic acid-binding Zn ribbon protein